MADNCSKCGVEIADRIGHICSAVPAGQFYSPDDESGEFAIHVEEQVDPNIGKVIAGRYRIVSSVGRGGMGVVYKAEHLTIERVVAIKMLYPHMVADAEVMKKFQLEAQAISKVDNGHTVRIYDFGISDHGQPFLVMDYVEGNSLRDLIKSHQLSLPQADEIITQVGEALSSAHKVGVIHRDLKPENIMLCERSGRDNWVQVVDFGISSFDGAPSGLRTQERIGSPPYMSPEQCTRGAVVDNRSDVYSLGVVLYECLSGRLPFSARTAKEMIEAHLAARPIPLIEISPALASCEALSELILRAMEKNPERRHQSVDEFNAELQEAIKRDQIRLSFLKNRKEQLSSTGQHLPVADEGAFSADRDGHFIFKNCPHCGESVDKDIAFCLGCGRTLATTQEFAKMRAAQGVFTLPKAAEDSSHSSQLTFSQKTRAVTVTAKQIRRTNNGLLLISLILLISIIWAVGGLDMIMAALSSLVKN